MSKLLDKLENYKESCLDDDGYILEGEAEDLVFESAKLIERYEKALEHIATRKMSSYLNINQMTEDFIKTAKEALKE